MSPRAGPEIDVTRYRAQDLGQMDQNVTGDRWEVRCPVVLEFMIRGPEREHELRSKGLPHHEPSRITPDPNFCLHIGWVDEAGVRKTQAAEPVIGLLYFNGIRSRVSCFTKRTSAPLLGVGVSA